MAIKHSITLSTTEPNNEVGVIKIRQADEQTQTLEVQITENGVPKSYQGLAVYFCAKLGQTAGLGIIEQKLNPEEMTNPANGKLEYTMRAEDWQILGRQRGYFSFRKMKNAHEFVEQFTTRDFTFDVIKSVYSDGLKEVKKDGSTYVWTIEDMLRLFDEYIASGKTDWEEFVEQNREILESVDPGGKLIGELIDARRPFGSGAYATLGERLDSDKAEVSAQLDQTSSQARASNITDVSLSGRKVTSVAFSNELNMPDTPYGGNEYVHPHRIHFPNRWNGYHYWMVVNPYINSSGIYENPCVYASNDKINWVEPTGISNPLKDWDGDITHYSDPCFVLDKNGRTLHIIHRRSGAGSDNIFYLMSSDDGVNWSEQVEVFRDINYEAVSPAVIQSGDKYYMYYIEVATTGNNKLKRVESADLLSWTNKVDCLLSDNTYNLWHIDVVGFGSGLILTANTMDFNRIMLFKSRDYRHFTLNSADFLTREVVGGRALYKPNILLETVDSSTVLSVLYNLNGDNAVGGNDWEMHNIQVPLTTENVYQMEQFTPELYYTIEGVKHVINVSHAIGYYKTVNGITNYYYQLDLSESVISALPPSHILQVTIPKNGALYHIVNTGSVAITGVPTQLTNLTSKISGGGATYMDFERVRDTQSSDIRMYTHKLAGITKLQGTINYFS